MARFRSKPIEIEAVQLTIARWTDWENLVERVPNGISYDTTHVWCATRQGVVQAAVDDWIIQESDGSGCYPCKPDVFAAKYEPIDPTVP